MKNNIFVFQLRKVIEEAWFSSEPNIIQKHVISMKDCVFDKQKL